MSKSIKEILDNFDNYNRYKKDGTFNVLIHPSLPYNFIELKQEFVDKLKAEIKMKCMLQHVGIEDLDACTKFTLFMLENSH